MSSAISVSCAKVHKYTVPLKRPFSTSRHTSTQSTNYLVVLASVDRIGVGEAAARGIKLTGDIRSSMPLVANEMVAYVNSKKINISDNESAINSIRDVYTGLTRIANKHAQSRNKKKPFRGLLSGFDIALLDLAAKSMGLTVSQLLDEQRSVVKATASTCSTSHAGGGLQARLMKQAVKFDAYRCKGAANTQDNIERLDAMRKANLSFSKNKDYWIDLNEALNKTNVYEFLDQVVTWLENSGGNDQTLILEQPIPKKYKTTLCRLQKYVDEHLDPSAGRIVIMADEALWDREDYDKLLSLGGVAGFNIKVPKVGGLLPALDLANKIYQDNPESIIYIGGMIGTSDIMGRAIYNLAKALPKVDHCTTSPARNVEENLADTPIRFRSKLSNEITLGNGLGLGTGVNYQALAKYETDLFAAPVEREKEEKIEKEKKEAEAVDSNGEFNSYAATELDYLGQKSLDSSLMEREALRHELKVVRLSFRHIDVIDKGGNGFSVNWTNLRGMPKKTLLACRRKYVSKDLFAKKGVPVAEGRAFLYDEVEEAVTYACELGWPVVIKPGIGTGGVGITASICSEENVRWAFDNIIKGKVAFERNDGHIIVEKHIDGEELRVFVADGQAVGAIKRIQAHVIGDGVSTVGELIKKKNAVRQSNPRLKNSRLKTNRSTLRELEKQGLTTKSIPDAGNWVILSSVKSISQGADTVNVLDEVHPSILEASVRAVQAIPGLRRGGLDFIVSDYTKPLDTQLSCVCEVNTSPSIAASHFPFIGKPANVAEKMLLCMAKEKNILLPLSDNNNEIALKVTVSTLLVSNVLKAIDAYFEKHGLVGGVEREQSETRIYVQGAFNPVSALPSNIFYEYRNSDVGFSTTSEVVSISPNWQDAELSSAALLLPTTTSTASSSTQEHTPLMAQTKAAAKRLKATLRRYKIIK